MAAGRNGRTVRDLRRANRTAVLQRLYFDGPLSRFELGPATGLSSGSVSNVVADLAADGLIEEAGSVGSDGGRPRTLLRVAPGSGHMIGVDVGETRVRVELFDLTLTELARAERPLAPSGTMSTWSSATSATASPRCSPPPAAPPRTCSAPGSRPGIVEHTPDRGAVVHGQTIGWDAVPLEELLRARSPLPDTVPYLIDNGAKTLGQAEMWFGAGRGARNAIVVLFGSGVGACLVTPEVEHGRAVEWGHLTVRVRGRRCRCGALGCLEAYAGAESLLARWHEEGGRVPDGTDEETALTAMLAAAYPPDGAAPDPVALAVLDETAEYLGARPVHRSTSSSPNASDRRLGRPPARHPLPARRTPPRPVLRAAPPRREGHRRPGPARPRRGDRGAPRPAAGGPSRAAAGAPNPRPRPRARLAPAPGA
ncbi:hypothetical protein SFUMM280S_10747 [Streptomyces fumanus]